MPSDGKQSRLTKRGDLHGHLALRGSEFDKVRRDGDKLVGKRMVVGLLPAPDGMTRLGIVVSRRYDGKAVIRNRARRLIRESFRLTRREISKSYWIVVIARKYMHDCSLEQVQNEFRWILDKSDVLPFKEKLDG